MRTTIELDLETHRLLRQIAKEKRTTMGQVVRQYLLGNETQPEVESKVKMSPVSGHLVYVGTGKPVTSEMVREMIYED